jgi:Uma2 family endonuclease
MGAVRRQVRHHDFEDYLALRQYSNVRLEYCDGEIYAMAGGSAEHSRLSAAITALLYMRRPSGCTALESNISIRPLASERATYADAVLVCGDYEFHPGDRRRETITNPSVVVEVLSDSTAEDDLTTKFDHYQLAPSLTDYVLIWQDEQRVEVRTRRLDGWLVKTYNAGDTVELHAGVTFTVDELYAK